MLKGNNYSAKKVDNLNSSANNQDSSVQESPRLPYLQQRQDKQQKTA